MIQNAAISRFSLRRTLVLLAVALLSASLPWARYSSEDTLVLDIKGMFNESCERYVEDELLSDLPGILEAEADHDSNQVTIRFDPSLVTPDELAAAINDCPYYQVTGSETHELDPELLKYEEGRICHRWCCRHP